MTIFKFVKKVFLSIFIFYILYLFNYKFLKKQRDNDLIRVSSIYASEKVYSVNFPKEKKYYTSLDECDIKTKPKYDVVNIGDSFSLQENLGYHNFIAKEEISLLNLFSYSYENPAQILVGLLNSGFFDKVQTKYVILESVERLVVKRLVHIDYEKHRDINGIQKEFIKFKREISKRQKQEEEKAVFFSKQTLKSPPINMMYSLGFREPIGAYVYRFKTKDSLFTNENSVLVYFEDIEKNNFNNNNENVIKVNDNLNKISDLLLEKGIKLIVLVCPDKYDYFYESITNREDLDKPVFFDKMRALEKKYNFIDSKKILKKVQHKKNVYYYYDSHWSPIAARIIGKKIASDIK